MQYTDSHHKAATRIQAGFRGSKVRKDLAKSASGVEVTARASSSTVDFPAHSGDSHPQ